MTRSTRRLTGFNDRVLSLCACGMSVRDVRSHLAGVYGVELSPDPISSPAPPQASATRGREGRRTRSDRSSTSTHRG
ncbi:transposase [Streptomyces pulveraceus]|uniref:Transposase n=1 Tax=Streptomyces pulveraceus TaxID=68258 RepID=A0ABW1GTZ3_9ACTN